MKKETNYFNLDPTEGFGEPLSEDEIFEGNTLFLKFMDFDYDKSRKWIINCALYDKSYTELMKVALKINTFWDKECSPINGIKAIYMHMIFKQIMDFNYFYRRTVKFIKEYYKFLEE